MLHGKRIGALIIAYQAARTIAETIAAVPRDVVDRLIVCDDGSTDGTAGIARALGVTTHCAPFNRGAGANTRLGFARLLEFPELDILVLLHGDNQYDPGRIPALVEPVALGACDAVLGNRVDWTRGSMPLYKRLGNTALTWVQNRAFGARLRDYATGYKAFSRQALLGVDWAGNADDFEFDEQLNAQLLVRGFRVVNVPVPTRYFPEARSVNLRGAIRYGLQTLKATAAAVAWKHGLRPAYAVRLFRVPSDPGSRTDGKGVC
jgi:glycosyltransferase involved in cell wall biosynthesis